MGRHRTPPEIQRLRGNPRKVAKRKLQSADPPKLPPPAAAPADAKTGEVIAPAAPEFDYPDFLQHPREREIFRLIISEFMPRNLARETDFNAYGRYATYMHMWINAKEQLGNKSTWYKTTSKHGEMLRRNPAFQDMLELGHELRQMEPQLALTPLARNAIYARYVQQPGGGALFDQGGKGAPEQPSDDAPLAPAADTPLGLLARAAASDRPN